jgi:hypothetical protein
MQTAIFKRILLMFCMCLSALPLAAQTVQVGGDITPNTAICLNNSTGATSVVQVQGGVADCSALVKSQGDALSIIVSGSASSGGVPGGECGASCTSSADCNPSLAGCFCVDEACTAGICDDDGTTGCPPPSSTGGQCGASCTSDAECDPSLAGCFCVDEACTAGICDDDGTQGCPAP